MAHTDYAVLLCRAFHDLTTGEPDADRAPRRAGIQRTTCIGYCETVAGGLNLDLLTGVDDKIVPQQARPQRLRYADCHA